MIRMRQHLSMPTSYNGTGLVRKPLLCALRRAIAVFVRVQLPVNLFGVAFPLCVFGQSLPTDTLSVCMVPASGTLYRIGLLGAPPTCVASTHVPYKLLPGATGPAGAAGQPGVPGVSGQPGAAGAAGPAGAAGAAGSAGAPGVPGSPGPQGSTGPAGSMGPVGPTGQIGPSGITGRRLISQLLTVETATLFQSSLTCPSGFVPISGGIRQTAAPAAVFAGSHPGSAATFDESTQYLSVYNNTGWPRTVTMYALCVPRT